MPHEIPFVKSSVIANVTNEVGLLSALESAMSCQSAFVFVAPVAGRAGKFLLNLCPSAESTENPYKWIDHIHFVRFTRIRKHEKRQHKKAVWLTQMSKLRSGNTHLFILQTNRKK